MKIVILDRKTLGFDVSVDIFSKFGKVVSFDTTKENETKDRIKDADIVLTNKVYVGENELKDSSVKLICITATGMNNVDLDYAKANNIEIKIRHNNIVVQDDGIGMDQMSLFNAMIL